MILSLDFRTTTALYLRSVNIDPVETLISLLKSHEGTTLWSLAIEQAKEVNTASRWRQLIQQLSSQTKDSLEGMNKIVGPLAAALLLICYDLKVLD